MGTNRLGTNGLGTRGSATRTHWVSGLGLAAWALAMAYGLTMLISGWWVLWRVTWITYDGMAIAITTTLLSALFAAAAGLLIWLRPRDGMVRYVALSLLLVGTVESGMTDRLIDPVVFAGAADWFFPVLLLRAMEMSCGLLLLYIYPDGHFRPGWTRPLAVVWVGLNLLWTLNPLLPFNVNYGPTWAATPLLSVIFSLLWVLTGVVARLGRLRLERQEGQAAAPISWSLIAFSLGLVAYYAAQFVQVPWLSNADYSLVKAVLLAVTLGWFPVILFRSMLRYGLHDGERLVGRALTGVALSMLVAGIYLLVILGVAQTFQVGNTLSLSVLATVFATLLFAPLRDSLQRGVNRFLYGERDQPMTALRTLTEQLALARTPQGALTVLAQTTAETLKLPYLGLKVSAPDVPFTLELGERAAAPEDFPLIADGAEVGVLTVCAGAPLTRDVRAMLGTVAQQAASAVQNWQLSAQVQRSREVLVDTREDERRRLRRELHDGLGPTLAAQTLRIGSARMLLGRDQGAVEGLLSQLENDVERAIGDVRRVVEDLRPPALDELGLPGALERALAELTSGLSLRVRVEVSAPLPPLRAAVEVAAYRIVMEAVTNVVRHAGARHCAVKLSTSSGALLVDVEDDGQGGACARPGGVGLRSMRERAEELGGTCTLSVSPAGTRLSATLPLREVSS